MTPVATNAVATGVASSTKNRRWVVSSVQFRRVDEDGASAVEYGLLVAGIAALISTIVLLLGGQIQGLFDDSCGTVVGEINGTSCGP